MGKKTLVLNASSGISGDMTVAALLDLGANRKKVEKAIESLHLEGAHIVISRVKKSALDACDFNVVLDEEHENHDHDMAYLHPDWAGHEHTDHDHHEHEHSHEHYEHEHSHEHHEHEHSYDHHDHDHSHDHHDHHHHGHHHGRNLADIRQILNAGQMSEGALDLALKIFEVVAQAESAVHGESIDHIHFHEVGAVDSIIDIAAAAVCIDDLNVSDVIVTDLSEGTGTVMCQHGLLPIPVPATSQILCAHQIPFHVLPNVKGELITPTGAAILAALEAKDRLPERFRIVEMGLGAGKRDYAASGVLRAMLIEPELAENRDEIIKLETNIDDSTGESLGIVMEILMEEGALDTYFTPVYMKKHRPAYVLNVLCTKEDKDRLEDIIFRNTTTIGIREIACGRKILPRKIMSVETPWGMADVKLCRIGDDTVIYPEADSVLRLCKASGIGYPEMYHRIKTYADADPMLNK